MGISCDEFSERLNDAGLMTTAEVRACLAAVSSPSPPRDGEQLARLLVKNGTLTAWQAKHIYNGKGRSLIMGNYLLLDMLGQGGMGMVLKARHRLMDRVVALKVLSPNIVKSQELLERFHREVRAAARLTHHNIVTAFDADEANGAHYLVMQYVEGRDLSECVRQHGPLPVDQALDYIIQAGQGLQYAHENGVIHRDIKPANLLLDNTGTIKILDMGLARIDSSTGSQADLTSTGTVMGTVDYMAPEQALNTKDADERSDLYSLGITLWYLLTGRPAYEGDSLIARLLAHREADIPSLQAERADVPAKVDAIFQRMVAKQPADRCQTMAAALDDLTNCVSGRPAPEMPTRPTPSFQDTSLDRFLGGLERSRIVPPAQATRKLSQKRQLKENAEATAITASSEVQTDPVTLTGLSQPSVRKSSQQQPTLARRFARPIFLSSLGGLLALLLLGSWFLMTRGSNGPSELPVTAQAVAAVPEEPAPPVNPEDDSQQLASFPEDPQPLQATPDGRHVALLAKIHPQRDPLLFNVASNQWEPGGWTLLSNGWQSELGPRTLLRMPYQTSARSFTLRIIARFVEGHGNIMINYPVGMGACYFSYNAFHRGEMSESGFGRIHNRPAHGNETTVNLPRVEPGQVLDIRIHVQNSADGTTTMSAVVNGDVITRFEGERKHLLGLELPSIPGADPTRFAVLVNNSRYLLNRVQLTEYGSGKPDQDH